MIAIICDLCSQSIEPELDGQLFWGKGIEQKHTVVYVAHKGCLERFLMSTSEILALHKVPMQWLLKQEFIDELWANVPVREIERLLNNITIPILWHISEQIHEEDFDEKIFTSYCEPRKAVIH